MRWDRFFAVLLLIVGIGGIALNFVPAASLGMQSRGSRDVSSLLNSLPAGNKGPKILSLSMYGALMDGQDSSVFGNTSSPAVRVRKQLAEALEDENVAGVILRINSPGGAVGISQELYEGVMRLREKGIPIYASMGDVAASGGYYVASACNVIYANPGTLTGSIGVLIQGVNFSGLMEKLGLEDQTVTAGKYKDVGSPLQPFTEQDRKILKALVSDTYDQFVSDVYRGRRSEDYGKARKNLTLSDIENAAQGKIYTGRQAQDKALVDELGGYEKALANLQDELKEKLDRDDDLRVVGSIGNRKWKRLININALFPEPPTSRRNQLFSEPIMLMAPSFVEQGGI